MRLPSHLAMQVTRTARCLTASRCARQPAIACDAPQGDHARAALMPSLGPAARIPAASARLGAPACQTATRVPDTCRAPASRLLPAEGAPELFGEPARFPDPAAAGGPQGKQAAGPRRSTGPAVASCRPRAPPACRCCSLRSPREGDSSI